MAETSLVLGLALAGTLFAALSVVDKLFGLIRHPFYLATAAYVSLVTLLGWAFFRGIHVRPSRLVRLSGYAALLLFNVLTAAYVLAWRLSADPTPVVPQLRIERELRRGDALLAAGDKDGAHLAYRDLYRAYPGSFPVLMRMGAVNYQVGDYPRARRYFSRALDLAVPASRWRALNDLGQTEWKLGNPREAVELYQQARAAGLPDSELTEWHYRLAWAYFDLKEYDAAIEHYQEVAGSGHSYVAASYYNIACALAKKYVLTADPARRRELARGAVENLRLAWRATTSQDEIEALRTGLLGKPGERDPELEPTRSAPEFQAFLAELQKD